MFSPSALHRQRFQKVTLTFLFFLLSVALIITWNTPATGYESSIYWSTPLILWISVIASVIAGITLVVVSIAKNELDNNPYWKIGFLLVFLSYAVCLGLFIIRGYYMWCMTGDPASHIGWIKETLNMGHTPTSLFYPITHIYLSEIVMLTSLDVLLLHKLIPLIFGLLCVLFMFVLAKAIFTQSPAACLLVGIISCCLAYSWYLRLTPNILANFFLPFVIFLVYRYLQRETWTWAVPLMICLILMPVFHTVPTIVLIVVFISICALAVFLYIYPYIKAQRQQWKLSISMDSGYRAITLLFIVIIWWIFWISLFSVFNGQVISFYETITSEKDDRWVDDLMDTASTASAYGYNVIEHVIRSLWGQIILCAISALSVPLIVKEFYKSRKNIFLVSLSISLLSTILLAVAFYLFRLGFTPQRFLFAIPMLGSFLTAYFLSFILTRKIDGYHILLDTRVKSTFVIIVVCSLFVGGLFALYPSPYTLSVSWHDTHSDVEGLLFVYEHRDVDIPLMGIVTNSGRFSHALLTLEERGVQKLSLDLADQRVPYRFGYDTNLSISSVYTRETDVLITEKDKRMYVDTLPEVEESRYSRQDFERLRIDPGLHFLYSNGEFDYYKVNV
jgi:hypothetical protein